MTSSDFILSHPHMGGFRLQPLNSGGHPLSVHGSCPARLGSRPLDAGLFASPLPSSSPPAVLGRESEFSRSLGDHHFPPKEEQ